MVIGEQKNAKVRKKLFNKKKYFLFKFFCSFVLEKKSFFFIYKKNYNHLIDSIYRMDSFVA